MKKRPISLVDPNALNRARYVRLFAEAGMHVEPYEDALELRGPIRFDGIYFTYDTGNLLKEVIATIQPEVNSVAVIAYSHKPTAPMIFRSLQVGAVDYLSEINPQHEQLLKALRSAEISIKQNISKRSHKANANIQMRKLTIRESQILGYLSEGSTNREIGEALGISERTVEVHRYNMQHKLGALTTAHAVRIGLNLGLVR